MKPFEPSITCQICSQVKPMNAFTVWYFEANVCFNCYSKTYNRIETGLGLAFVGYDTMCQELNKEFAGHGNHTT